MDSTIRSRLSTERNNLVYVLAGVAVIAALLVGMQQGFSPATGEDLISVELTVDGSTETVQVPVNSTAFMALNRTHSVAYEESSFGYFITSIDGVSQNGTHSWLYFVDGEPASKAANRLVVSDGDSVTFRYMSNERGRELFE